MALDVIQPSRNAVMIKPVGALCNLDCGYCYYLPTKALYDGHQQRMSDQILEDLFACLLRQGYDGLPIESPRFSLI